MEVEFFLCCVIFLYPKTLKAPKITSYDIEKNGYDTCCIIGGNLGFPPETTCNMEVRLLGLLFCTLDLLVLKTYI